MACLKKTLFRVHSVQCEVAVMVAARGLLYMSARSPNEELAATLAIKSPLIVTTQLPAVNKSMERHDMIVVQSNRASMIVPHTFFQDVEELAGLTLCDDNLSRLAGGLLHCVNHIVQLVVVHLTEQEVTLRAAVNKFNNKTVNTCSIHTWHAI